MEDTQNVSTVMLSSQKNPINSAKLPYSIDAGTVSAIPFSCCIIQVVLQIRLKKVI